MVNIYVFVTDTEEKKDQEENETEAEENTKTERFRQRVLTSLVVIGGVISAVLTHIFLSFDSIVGISTIVPVVLLVNAISFIYFDRADAKLVLFSIGISVSIWFITGTLILQQVE